MISPESRFSGSKGVFWQFWKENTGISEVKVKKREKEAALPRA